MPDISKLGLWTLTDYVDHCMLSDSYHSPERFTPAEAVMTLNSIEDDDKLTLLTDWLAKVTEDE